MNERGAPAFENLSEDEQTEVLRYLEATNGEDLEEATRVLHGFGFNTAQAISHKFGASGPTDRGNHTHQHREPTLDQQRELGQYIRHLQQQLRERTLWKILSGMAKGTAKSVLRRVGGLVLPNCLKERLLLSKFDRMHLRTSLVKFQSTSL